MHDNAEMRETRRKLYRNNLIIKFDRVKIVKKKLRVVTKMKKNRSTNYTYCTLMHSMMQYFIA